ncbi:hypothetical protein [Spirosoma endophyticum]|uniref:hypothetical protein n=1 Tax=Spirosoma endophyticum TaxID=662367 RepID=UPI0015A6F48F|nr:hypothetical protein [Spirosoma endophyticum]
MARVTSGSTTLSMDVYRDSVINIINALLGICPVKHQRSKSVVRNLINILEESTVMP